MTFYDALKKVADGRGIRRYGWPEGAVAMLTPVDNEGRLYIQTDAKTTPAPWIVSESDMAATDWWLVGHVETSPSPSPSPATP